MNVIGGTQWKVAGDWLEWTTKVEKEGDYVIGIKGRQGYNRGYIANRSLYIDGEIPFKEVVSLQFTYSNVCFAYRMIKARHTNSTSLLENIKFV